MGLPRRAAALSGVVLLHGAGSGPWIFEGWRSAVGTVVAPDLQGGLNVAAASMLNYEATAARAAEGVPRPLVLAGWSMGGLVALMAARRVAPDLLVLLEPSPPAEVQGRHEDVALEEGTFDPEATYGPFPAGVRARPESLLARAERKRGIPVPELPCPAVVVAGDEFAEERGAAVAKRYGAELVVLRGIDHWGLVLDEAARAAVLGRFPGAGAS